MDKPRIDDWVSILDSHAEVCPCRRDVFAYFQVGHSRRIATDCENVPDMAFRSPLIKRGHTPMCPLGQMGNYLNDETMLRVF